MATKRASHGVPVTHALTPAPLPRFRRNHVEFVELGGVAVHPDQRCKR